MMLVFIYTLGISIVGMGSILALKRYELSSGTVFFSGARPRASAFFNTLSIWFMHRLPATARWSLRALWAWVRSLLHRGTAKAVIATEFVLEKALRTVKEKTTPERIPGEASAFLREVANHKKKLLHRARSRTRRTISEE